MSPALIFSYRDTSGSYREPNFFVFYSVPSELLRLCHKCSFRCTLTLRQLGTYAIVRQGCSTCGFCRIWQSQPMEGNRPVGNLFLSTSMLFSGVSPAKFIWAVNFFSCLSFDEWTFHRHQSSYLQPAVSIVWEREQATLLQDVKSREKQLDLGEDGQADSLGHSAKYSLYSVLDFHLGKVLKIQLVQVRAME